MLHDEKFMKMAIAEAEKARDASEIPVGAVIVKNGEVIARAHNLCEAQNDPTAHAEMLAIRAAGERLGTWRLSECTLYVTLEPCPMCTGAAINARVKRIVFGAKDPRAGACGSLCNLPAYPLECKPEITHGIGDMRSRELLRAFFAQKRDGKTN